MVSHHQPRTYHLPYSRVPTRPGVSLSIFGNNKWCSRSSDRNLYLGSDIQKLGRNSLRCSDDHSHFPKRLVFSKEKKNGGEHLKTKKSWWHEALEPHPGVKFESPSLRSLYLVLWTRYVAGAKMRQTTEMLAHLSWRQRSAYAALTHLLFNLLFV